MPAGQVPVDRQISYMVASNLYTDSEELLRNLHLAPYLKPVVSLIDDFPQQQRHKGWQFGYAVAKDNYDQVRTAVRLMQPLLLPLISGSALQLQTQAVQLQTQPAKASGCRVPCGSRVHAQGRALQCSAQSALEQSCA